MGRAVTANAPQSCDTSASSPAPPPPSPPPSPPSPPQSWVEPACACPP